MPVGTFGFIPPLLLLVIATYGLPAAAQAPISAVISTDGMGKSGLQFAQNIVAALGAQAHLQMKAVSEPNERSVVNFRAGLYQLIVGRQASFDQLVPGSHRVNTPILAVNYMAVTTDPGSRFQQWSDVKDMSVGYVFGNRYVMQAIDGLARRAEPAPTSQACLAMAAERRVDVCVVGVAPNVPRPKQIGDVVLYDSKLDSVELYIWTHPSQGPLADQLNAALLSMKQRGEIDRLQLRAD